MNKNTNKSEKLASLGEQMGIDTLNALDNLISLVSDYHKIDNIDYHLIKQKLLELKELEDIKQELKQLKKENKELLTKLTKVCSAFYKSYDFLLGCEQYNLMSIKNNEYEKELYNIIDEVQNGKKED